MIAIPITHIHSCFRFRGEGGVGTAFGITVAKARWLVTAKHNLGGAEAGNLVQLGTTEGWTSSTIREIRRSDTSDVAVMTLENFDGDFPLDGHGNDENPTLGQELKFLGFPHGLGNTYNSPLGYSTPLCRTAFLSGAVSDGSQDLLVLDGFNNPGYSGAPVWYGGAKTGHLYLLAVISGYRVEERSKSLVYQEVEGGLEKAVPGMFVKPNSGMIHAVPVRDVLKLIV